VRVLTAVILFALWLVLSSTFDPAHVAAGAAVAALIAWISPALPSMRRLSWTAAAAYQPWLFGRILKSGLHVSRLILDPKLPISPELVRHQTNLRSDGELVALGNSITLTPGTITVEVAPGELIVHAIDEESRKDLLDGRFEAKIGGVFSAQEGQR
jgi:multicomponent Na+:H+ antiporter subunit E